MFKRKLSALGYTTPDSFNIKDEQSVRKLVVWLEDQKIRHYAIEARRPLKQITEKSWPLTFEKYLSDMQCPLAPEPLAACVDWLLAVAVQLEYSENPEQYRGSTAAALKASQEAAPTLLSDNPLDALDHTSQDYRDGVLALAGALGLPPGHPDPLVTLAAVSHVVASKLSEAAIKAPRTKPTRKRAENTRVPRAGRSTCTPRTRASRRATPASTARARRCACSTCTTSAGCRPPSTSV